MAQTKKDKIEAAVKRAGVEGPNKPKRTPSHPTKSHIVVAVEGEQVKIIRFGQERTTCNDGQYLASGISSMVEQDSNHSERQNVKVEKNHYGRKTKSNHKDYSKA